MSIYTKLLEVQKEIGAISKDSTNPFFKSKYFDINKLIQHVNPILTKNGLVLLQPIKDGCQYSIIIDSETAEQVDSFLCLSDIKDPQKRGSEITYFRRYTLGSLLGLQAEDDDANTATKEANKKPLLTPDSDNWEKAKEYIKGDKKKIGQIKAKYEISEENQKLLVE